MKILNYKTELAAGRITPVNYVCRDNVTETRRPYSSCRGKKKPVGDNYADTYHVCTRRYYPVER